MKKFLAALLSILMLISMAACGDSKAPETESPDSTAPGTETTSPEKEPKDDNAATGDPITLQFPTWQATEPGVGEWWTLLAEQFQDDHPNVTISLEQIPFAQYIDNLTTQFAAGSPPDIVHIPSRYFIQFANQGWLEDLSSEFATTDMFDTWTPLQDNMMWNDSPHGMLLLGYGFVLYYNEALLDAAGIEVPQTPDELLAAAQKLTEGDIYGFGLTTTDHPNVQQEAGQILTGLGLDWEQDGEYLFTGDEHIDAFELYRSLAQCSPLGVTIEQKRELFFAGKIAMTIDGPFIISTRDTADESVGPYIKIARAPFEYVPGAMSNSLHMPAGLSAQKRDLVWEFMQMAGSEEWQQKLFELYQVIPPRGDAVTDAQLDASKDFTVFAESNAEAVLVEPKSLNIQINYNEFQKICASHLIELQVTDKSTEQVLEELLAELKNNVPA